STDNSGGSPLKCSQCRRQRAPLQYKQVLQPELNIIGRGIPGAELSIEAALLLISSSKQAADGGRRRKERKIFLKKMSLQSHVKLQDDIHVRLSRAKINFKKSPKDRITIQYLETRLEMIEELWAQFTVTHTQIIKDVEYEQLTSSPYIVNEVYFNTEELYLDLKCELKTALALEFLGTKSSKNIVCKERVFHTAASTTKLCPKKLGKKHMREKEIYNQMNELIAKRGFTVQNGLSNSSELLGKIIGKTHSFKGLDEIGKEINKQASNKIKQNGLTWNRTCDTFQYSVQLPVREKLKLKEKRSLP
ncbi:hypothetical protein SFRURICE_010292, partial [Spodoptera frugiperda]